MGLPTTATYIMMAAMVAPAVAAGAAEAGMELPDHRHPYVRLLFRHRRR
jgi:TRAP-type uncharacterized transport system fused permease subunit